MVAMSCKKLAERSGRTRRALKAIVHSQCCPEKHFQQNRSLRSAICSPGESPLGQGQTKTVTVDPLSTAVVGDGDIPMIEPDGGGSGGRHPPKGGGLPPWPTSDWI